MGPLRHLLMGPRFPQAPAAGESANASETARRRMPGLSLSSDATDNVFDSARLKRVRSDGLTLLHDRDNVSFRGSSLSKTAHSNNFIAK